MSGPIKVNECKAALYLHLTKSGCYRAGLFYRHHVDRIKPGKGWKRNMSIVMSKMGKPFSRSAIEVMTDMASNLQGLGLSDNAINEIPVYVETLDTKGNVVICPAAFAVGCFTKGREQLDFLELVQTCTLKPEGGDWQELDKDEPTIVQTMATTTFTPESGTAFTDRSAAEIQAKVNESIVDAINRDRYGVQVDAHNGAEAAAQRATDEIEGKVQDYLHSTGKTEDH